MKFLSIALFLISPVVIASDPFLWLEERSSQKSMEWVKAQNQKSLDWLKQKPHLQQLKKEVDESLQRASEFPSYSITNGFVYSFKRSNEKPKGVWLRIAIDQLYTQNPKFEVLFDLDQYNAQTGQTWYWAGSACLGPQFKHCMIHLSPDGGDRVSSIEYDLELKKPVHNGFRTPLGKGSVAWIDSQHLLVSSDFGPDSLTDSGYPRLVKLFKRGLNTNQAPVVFEASKRDIRVTLSRIQSARFGTAKISAQRNFFTSDEYLMKPNHSLAKLNFPSSAEIKLIGTSLIAYSEKKEKWAGVEAEAGTFFELDLSSSQSSLKKIFKMNLDRTPIFMTTSTQDRLWVAYFENVHGQVGALKKGSDSIYRFEKLPLPPFGISYVRGGDPFGDQLLIQHTLITKGFSNYHPVFLANGKVGLKLMKSMRTFSNPEELTVAQHFAKSFDGTLVPYFIVRPKKLISKPLPTVLYGYGGFGSVVHADTLYSWFPFYMSSFVPRGGAFVLAGIRGGGEYGERWHQAGILNNRPSAIKDFIAVSEDLIRRKYTDADHLGIRGDSNGGILMGAAIADRPDLFKAMVAKHGLFDMYRFTQMEDAGKSWIDEYGNPANPAIKKVLDLYEPYHRLKKGVKYPSVLLGTATSDDRVHPAHMRKAAAKLQSFGQDVLFYENDKGGHTRSDLEYRRLESLMELEFFIQKLGIKI